MERYTVINDTKKEHCGGDYATLADAQWAVPDLLGQGDEYTIVKVDAFGRVEEPVERGICSVNSVSAETRH